MWVGAYAEHTEIHARKMAGYFVGWVMTERGFALAVSLALQGCTDDPAAPASALHHDSEVSLLDWDKQSVVVNLSCSVVQNNFIQTRVPNWSYSMSTTWTFVVSVTWVVVCSTSKTTGNHLLYTLPENSC